MKSCKWRFARTWIGEFRCPQLGKILPLILMAENACQQHHIGAAVSAAIIEIRRMHLQPGFVREHRKHVGWVLPPSTMLFGSRIDCD